MRFVPVLLALSVPLAALAQPAASLLAPMRDHDRPVLVFGGDGDARVQTQYADLSQHAAELQARQMRIVLITRDLTRSTPGTEQTPPPGTVAATTPEATALRARFHVAVGAFAVILVGKDGGEKFRSTKPVAFDRLRSLVDAMPMRQQEMRTP